MPENDDDPLSDRATKLSSREEFVVFLDDLLADFSERPEQWENGTLAEFLGALAAFAHDARGYYANMHPEVDVNRPDWRIFADMLLAARVYE